MRYRKLDENGDYVIGGGETDFWIDVPQTVAQSVMTRLLLWEGEWFLDTTDGTPYSQEILGYGNSTLRDMAIKSRILDTSGVTSINDYESSVDPVTRALIVSCTIQTAYGEAAVGPVTL